MHLSLQIPAIKFEMSPLSAVLILGTLSFGGVPLDVKPGGGFAPRVIGGGEIPIIDAPYMATIRDGTSNVCGASVVSAFHVVTTCHCTDLS